MTSQTIPSLRHSLSSGTAPGTSWTAALVKPLAATALAALLALAGWMAWIGVSARQSASPAALAAQLEGAAHAGGGVWSHVYGGTIRSEHNGRLLALVADGIPADACPAASTRLLRKGVLSINGTMPLRPSSTRLEELCRQEGDKAVLTWIPSRTE